jgi:hypothetical protein
MVDNLNLTTLISQIPEAQKIHHTQLSHPEAQQALAQEMVLRRQKLEQKQVAKSEATAEETQVNPDDRQQGAQDQFQGKRRQQSQDSEFESDQGRLIDTQV